jgi:RimJ/RimL family protein N-acetyltransferase
MLTIRTERLDLVAATLAHLDSELKSPSELGAILCARVPDGWPPGEYDRPAIEFFRARLAEETDGAGWYTWYAVERSPHGQCATVVGAGGYFGPPTRGSVEIGYSVLPAFRGRGFATELVAALVSRAFSTPGVISIIAHTQADNLGSITVLERCGFAPVGPGQEPGTVRYAQSRMPVQLPR